MPDQPKAPKGQEWYLRPGTTEPELRPIQTPEGAAAAEGEAESAVAPELKGKLSDDFPGHSALVAAGITTYPKVRKQVDSLEEIEGIGPATADKIREAMNASSEEEEEPE